MAWLNLCAADLEGFLSLNDLATLFSKHPRTVREWVARWSVNPKLRLRIAYHPDPAAPEARRVLHPLIYVHLEDVLLAARLDGITIDAETMAQLREEQ